MDSERLPVAGAHAFAGAAARTALARLLLATVLLALVTGAALAARHPHLTARPFLPPNADGIVVLDLSASITSDTYSRIHETLQKLVSRGGRYGLVVFSNVAYEALPPGTPASALAPIIRYFTVPRQTVPGEQPNFPVNPWSASFTSGTEISLALDLARTIELEAHVRHPAVLLISDLADDPDDLNRLTAVILEYQIAKIRLTAIALNADPSDIARFSSLIGRASSIIPAALSGQHPNVAVPPRSSFPTLLVLLTTVVAALLAVNELREARLRWDDTTQSSANSRAAAPTGGVSEARS